MNLQRLGTHYGGRWVDLSRINSQSLVYSGGIGEDASFDLELIKRTNCTIHAFDPTPRSIVWVKRQTMPSKFIFHSVGLASCNGQELFYPPADPTWVSHSMVHPEKETRPPIMVEFKRLDTLMKELGHTKLDVLKLDIEGAEYETLDIVLQQHIAVDQICVEFHPVGDIDTKQEVERLCKAGFDLIRQDQHEYTFLKRLT